MEKSLTIQGRAFTWRAAGNADRDGIVRLVKMILPEFGEVFDDQTSESDLANIEKTYLETGGAFDLLLDAGLTIIGTIGLLPVGPGCCKLRKMYIDPGYRNLGLGKWLVSHILEKAKGLGFELVILETISSMRAAIALYEKAGFTRIGQRAASPRCDIVMEKKL
jgi:GNAT superfamily N-acetyltransferase